ncbi:MAG: 4Fe-4S binding protein [Candidatus Syntropharchaeales archaeon]
MTDNDTISQVVKDNLCTGCGTCLALCPNEAIEMVIDEKKGVYVPELNEEKCNNCGICYKVCPGHEVDFKELNLEIFGKEPENVLIGNYLNCYVGHATDHEIRYNSASGGLVTQLLIHRLWDVRFSLPS